MLLIRPDRQATMTASNLTDPPGSPDPTAPEAGGVVDDAEGTIVLEEVSVAMQLPQAPPAAPPAAPHRPPPPPRAPHPPPHAAHPPATPPRPTAAAEAAQLIEESTIAIPSEALEAVEVEEVPSAPTAPPAMPVDPEGVTERAKRLAVQLFGLDRTATLSGIYERELETLQTRPEAEVAQPLAELHHEIGELVEGAGDAGSAVKFYAKALSADPSLHPNVWAIRRIFESRGLWPNLSRLLDAELLAAHRPEERAELLLEKGELCEDRLGDPATAQRCFEEAVAAQPGSLRGWQALYRMARRAEDTPRTLAALDGLAAATTDAGRKVAALLERARLDEELHAADPRPALETLGRALAQGALTERVLDEMELVAERAADRDVLLAVWEQRAQGASASLQVYYRLRQARACSDDPTRALGYLDQARQLEPDNLVVLWERLEVVRALPDVAQRTQILGEVISEARLSDKAVPAGLLLELRGVLRASGDPASLAAVEAELESTYPQLWRLHWQREHEAVQAGDLEALVQCLLSEAKAADAADDKRWAAAALWEAGCLLCDVKGEIDRGVELLRQAYGRVPSESIFEATARAYERAAQPVALVELLETRLASTAPAVGPGERLRLLERLAAARELALGDLRGAAAVLDQLAKARAPGLLYRHRRVDLLRRAGAWEEVAAELAELVDASDPEQRADLCLEAGEINERLGKLPVAMQWYRRALEQRPSDRQAQKALEELSHQGSAEAGPGEADLFALAQALRKQLDATADSDEAARLLTELGVINEVERKRPAEAAQNYLDLLDRKPDASEALLGLYRVYRTQQDWSKAAAMLERHAGEVSSEAARAELLLWAAEIHEDRLRQSDAAADLFARSMQAHPTSHAALGLFRAAVRAADGGRLATALAALAEVLPPGSTARAVREEQAATLLATDERQGALEVLGALAASGNEPSLAARLERLVAAAGADDRQSVELSVRELSQAAASAGWNHAWTRRAAVRAALAATGAAEGPVTLATDGLEARRDAVLLTDFAVAAPAILAGALEARASLAAPTSRVEWQLHRAEVLVELGQLVEATQLVEGVLQNDPIHIPALLLRHRIAHLVGSPLAIAHAALRVGVALAEDENAAGYLREAADLFAQLNHALSAAACYRQVLDRTPLDGESYLRCQKLLLLHYQKTRAAGPLIELLAHQISHAPDGTALIGYRIDRAQLLFAERDLDGAERDLRAVLEIDAEHRDALERLAEVVSLDGARTEEGRQIWRRLHEIEREPVRRRRILLRMATLEEESGHLGRAIELCEEAIDIETTNPDLDRLATLLCRTRQWQRAVEVLQQLGRQVEAGSQRAVIELRLAAVYRDGLRDMRAAIDALCRALKHDPLELEAMARLVALSHEGHVVQLELEERLDESIEAARQLLEGEPLRATVYERLAKLWAWRNQDDLRLLAAQAAQLVAGTTAPMRTHYEEPSRELTPASWERIMPELARSAAMAIWEAASEGANKLYGGELQALGAGRSERISPKSLPPAWVSVDRLARSLGNTEYELYQSTRAGMMSVVGNALVCSSSILERLGGAERVHLVRRLGLMRFRLGPLEHLDAEELAIFFAACARLAETARPAVLELMAAESRIEDRTKLLGRALDRKHKKALVALGREFALLPDPREWQQAVLEGMARLALLVTGDLQLVLATLGLDVRRNTMPQRLLRFSMSQEFLALRRELGMKGS